MNYKRIYDAIIANAKLRDELFEYYKRHHILPRSLGGSDELDNLVKLTYREHYLCHRLLTRIYPDENKMHYAFWMMSNRNEQDHRMSSRAYAEVRENFVKCISVPCSDERRRKLKEGMTDERRKKISDSRKAQSNDHWVGRKHKEESKIKMSESAKTRNTPNESVRREKISNSHTGKAKSEEHRKNISEAKKGDKNPMYGKIGKNHHNSQIVIQLDLEGNFVKEWENAKRASEELGISYQGIRNCVNGKQGKSGKFKWSKNNE